MTAAVCPGLVLRSFATLPRATRGVARAHQLAWLFGRADIDGLDPAGLM